MALTGRLGLAALLGVLVVAIVGATPIGPGVAFVAVNGVLLLGVVLDVLVAAAVRPLMLARTGDESIRLGEPADVGLTITNPGRRRLRAQVRDAWPPSAGATSQRQRIEVPSGERRRLTTHLVPTRRGDRHATRVTVRSAGPFGLAARQGSHVVPWRVRVLPPFRSRRHLPAKLARLRELDGRTLVMVRGQGSEFDSLREYVPGDDVRSIDWRASARTADVMVRTWRPERDRHLLLVLDTGRTAAGRVGDAPRLDAAMDAALLLAALASRAGDRVDLLAFDRTTRARVVGASPNELLTTLVNAMAPLEASLVETDWSAATSAILRQASRRSLVVLLTGLDPAPLEEGLLPVLPQLAKRHRVVLASVADPRVDSMAEAREDTRAVYGAASAERTRSARLRVRTQLQLYGVDVVDADPEALPPALADTYLALKAAGRL